MPERARVFVAVRPRGDAQDSLDAVMPMVPASVRPTPREQWHVTLRFLGRCDPVAVIERLGSAALPGCTAALGASLEVLGGRVLVAPVEGLEPLAGAVSDATSGLGREPAHAFRGHLTLGRARPGTPVSELPAGQQLKPARWVPTTLEVIASELDHHGARHELLAEVPLLGSDAPDGRDR